MRRLDYDEQNVFPFLVVVPAFCASLVWAAGSVVRHMVATPQGEICIACSGVGKAGVMRVER